MRSGEGGGDRRGEETRRVCDVCLWRGREAESVERGTLPMITIMRCGWVKEGKARKPISGGDKHNDDDDDRIHRKTTMNQRPTPIDTGGRSHAFGLTIIIIYPESMSFYGPPPLQSARLTTRPPPLPFTFF